MTFARTFILLSIAFLLFGCIQLPDQKETKLISDSLNLTSEPATSDPQLPFEINDSGFNESDSELEIISEEFASLPTIYYYHSTLCAISKAVRPTVDSIHAKFNKSVDWKEFNVVNKQGLDAFNKHADIFNIPNESRLVPMLVVGGKHFVGIESINGSVPINETIVSEEISRWLNNETDSS